MRPRKIAITGAALAAAHGVSSAPVGVQTPVVGGGGGGLGYGAYQMGAPDLYSTKRQGSAPDQLYNNDNGKGGKDGVSPFDLDFELPDNWTDRTGVYGLGGGGIGMTNDQIKAYTNRVVGKGDDNGSGDGHKDHRRRGHTPNNTPNNKPNKLRKKKSTRALPHHDALDREPGMARSEVDGFEFGDPGVGGVLFEGGSGHEKHDTKHKEPGHKSNNKRELRRMQSQGTLTPHDDDDDEPGMARSGGMDGDVLGGNIRVGGAGGGSMGMRKRRKGKGGMVPPKLDLVQAR